MGPLKQQHNPASDSHNSNFALVNYESNPKNCDNHVKKEFLTINELKEISALNNADIGSHTVSHPYLTRLNDREVMHELLDSKHFLEDALGKPIKLFAYPHGDYDKRIRDLVEEAGYEVARNSKFNTNIEIKDKLLINSTEIWNFDSIPVFKEKINGSWDWLKHIQN